MQKSPSAPETHMRPGEVLHSDKIVHGLGFGPVTIELGYEVEHGSDRADVSGAHHIYLCKIYFLMKGISHNIIHCCLVILNLQCLIIIQIIYGCFSYE